MASEKVTAMIEEIKTLTSSFLAKSLTTRAGATGSS